MARKIGTSGVNVSLMRGTKAPAAAAAVPFARRLGMAWAALRGKVRVRSGTPYAAADVNRLTGDWASMRMHPDDELRFNLERLRVRARDLERNSGLIRHFLRMLGTNVIGPNGIHVRPVVRDNSDKLNKGINDKIRDGWDEWCESPTIDGKQDMVGFQTLVLKTVARDGEAFIRKWRAFDGNRFRFGLEAIDPDQFDQYYNQQASATGGNEIRLSVEVDSLGRPVAYHMWDRPDRTLLAAPGRKRIRVPADEIIHLYDPERINQTRGVTWLASVMVPVRMLEGYREAKLVEARLGASSMGFLKRVMDQGTGTLVEDAAGGIEFEVEPGTFKVLPDGYELQTWDPTSPGSEFGQFVKDATRGAAIGLGVSYNALASDLEGVNYSSMRSGLLSERELWMQIQQWWISRFLRPVYREWVNMALLSGALVLDSRDPMRFRQARFRPRGWAWVDPYKETQAGVIGIQSGLASRTRLLASQGEDFGELLEELKEETEQALAAGVDVSGPEPAASGKPTDPKPVDENTDDESGKPARNGTARHSRETGMDALLGRR